MRMRPNQAFRKSWQRLSLRLVRMPVSRIGKSCSLATCDGYSILALGRGLERAMVG
jgi:hypothetical protein